jgi:hypothetical protein
MSLLAELKRRKVVRLALVYAVVAWGVAQVADLAVSTFGAPEWVMQVLVVLLLLGLPVAAVLAWAFEVTPDGVRRATGAPTARRRRPRGRPVPRGAPGLGLGRSGQSRRLLRRAHSASAQHVVALRAPAHR